MTLEELIKTLTKYMNEFSDAKVVYQIECGKSKSFYIWRVYPEVFHEGEDVQIVISNKD